MRYLFLMVSVTLMIFLSSGVTFGQGGGGVSRC